MTDWQAFVQGLQTGLALLSQQPVFWALLVLASMIRFGSRT